MPSLMNLRLGTEILPGYFLHCYDSFAFISDAADIRSNFAEKRLNENFFWVHWADPSVKYSDTIDEALLFLYSYQAGENGT